VGGPPSSGSHGILESAGPSLVGVSALGYPSGLAHPPDSSIIACRPILAARCRLA